jgi:SMC interacting uncharacterized protein involved in chromosome segregation
MKTTEHIEYLLRQGRKPKELQELGFSKRVITRVSRKLRQEKRKPEENSAKTEKVTSGVVGTPINSHNEIAKLESRLAAMDSDLKELKEQTSELREAILEAVTPEELEERLDGAIGLGIKQKFGCQCGATGFVAMRVRCTQCGRESWWGWHHK